MEIFKQLLTAVLIVAAPAVNAQISTGKVEPKDPEKKEAPAKPEKPKAPRVKREPSDGLNEFSWYLGAGRASSERTLTSNEAPFGAPLGERAAEYGLKTWTYQIGARNRVSKWLSYDVGFAIDRFGETFEYRAGGDSDSTLFYTSTYSYSAIPIQLFLTYGKEVRFFVGGGIEPQLLSGYVRSRKWTTTLSSTGSDELERTEGLNSMNMGILLSGGVQLRMGKYASLYCLPTYMWNLTNTYDKQNDYVHKARSFTIKFGVVISLQQGLSQ